MFSVLSNDKYTYLRVFNKNLLRFKRDAEADVEPDEEEIKAPFKKKKERDKKKKRKKKRRKRDLVYPQYYPIKGFLSK